MMNTESLEEYWRAQNKLLNVVFPQGMSDKMLPLHFNKKNPTVAFQKTTTKKNMLGNETKDAKHPNPN